MNFTPNRRAIRRAVFILGTLVAGCGYDSGYVTLPETSAPASVSMSFADESISVGQSTRATASLRDQFGAVYAGTAPVFTSSNPAVATVGSVTGRITGFGHGTVVITATSGKLTTTRILAVGFPEIFINEVLPLSESDTGWVELYNPTTHPIDMSGWYVTNADESARGVFPNGSVIVPGGFLVVNEHTFPSGLQFRDFVRLFSGDGSQSDAFAWGHNPIHSYGRCPDGESGLSETSIETRGGRNAC